MSRSRHDLANDHFGVLGPAQIAGGTATSGYAPISNGDDTVTWGIVSGVHLADDTTTFSSDGVVFTDGFQYIAAEGSTSSVYGTINFATDIIDIYTQAAIDQYAYVDVSSSGGLPVAVVYAQSDDSTWAEMLFDGADGSSTFSGFGPVTFDQAVIMMPNLPTSDPSNPGQLWVDSGVLKVSL